MELSDQVYPALAEAATDLSYHGCVYFETLHFTTVF